ncbi:hypothetical protein CDL15_Pgr005203 [Punica granatum]|uniref:Uncharacterized protein n=1 Tax=Punica granatum TaxID=22663 RepID=A0A218WPT1_PUNGR|nr:hypothetical protein CDL15_Pgr005203 [Punica granatum]
MRDSSSLASLATRRPVGKTESKPGYHTHLNYRQEATPTPHPEGREDNHRDR